ncbi:MAG: two-component system sensor histidine kinase NtrB [Terriglobales bacterium]
MAANPGPLRFIDAANGATKQENDERLRLAMDAAGMGAWDWDLKSGHVTWTGDQELLYGLQPGTFDQDFSTFLSLVHPDDMAAMQARMDAAVAERKLRHRDEFRIVRPDGSIRWMVANGRIFYDEQGNAVRMIGVNMDVTDRKYAEEALRQTEKLAATGRLAATIAHELNNPLASVTNLLYILGNHAGLAEEAKSYVTMAQQELARVSYIVRQTLSFHRQSEFPVALSLTELLDTLLPLLEARSRGRSIRIERRFEGEHITVGFPAELRQVFSNLLINAVEASKTNGLIVVHVFPSRRWNKQPEIGTRVIIADNGVGISLEHRRHILEPFFTTKGDKGSGLGLWVTAGIIEKHGGSLRMTSSTTPGRTGTTFSVFLPRGEGSGETAVEPPRRLRAQPHPVQLPLLLGS